jgi:hypothetical protein
MKIELDNYTKFLLTLVVLCLVIAVYYKCVKYGGISVTQASVFQVPPPAVPQKTMGFLNT